MDIADMTWMPLHAGRFAAWPVLGEMAIVAMQGNRWVYKFNGCECGSYATAEEAQNACNAEHKELISKWIIKRGEA